MKHLYAVFAVCLLFCGSLHGQSFTVAYDTVYITPGSDTDITNSVINLTAAPINVNWKIAATNFPAGWIPGSAICDVDVCHYADYLWPSATTESSGPYIPGSNTYRVILDLASVPSTGIYYLTVMMHNPAIPADSASQTYITAAGTTSGIRGLQRTSEATIYPNPAQNELNIVYDASADIKSIAVYNIIGKVMSVYKVTANTSANLDINNLPSGIYFARLANNSGQVLVTKKFTKQ